MMNIRKVFDGDATTIIVDITPGDPTAMLTIAPCTPPGVDVEDIPVRLPGLREIARAVEAAGRQDSFESAILDPDGHGVRLTFDFTAEDSLVVAVRNHEVARFRVGRDEVESLSEFLAESTCDLESLL
jgi:hypothetical protein